MLIKDSIVYFARHNFLLQSCWFPACVSKVDQCGAKDFEKLISHQTIRVYATLN